MVFRRPKKMAAGSKTPSAASNDFCSLVSKRAYQLYEKRGHGHGSDWSDWFTAEQQLKKELRVR
ncbi:MAG: DUF2934 domain-containing protein [Candidatus Omnitrophica bacterium]|nr:DUF2934 domain-containing protein [Candidatus Omnitrophota bacterium]